MSEIKNPEINSSVPAINYELELSEGTENSFVPIPVKITISHQTGRFEIGGLPSQGNIDGIILAARRARVLFPTFGNKDVTDNVAIWLDNHPFCSSENAIDSVLVDKEWDNINIAEKDAILMLKSHIAKGGLKCAFCPLSKWGSVELLGGKGRSQVCKETRRLLIYRGTPIPMMMNIPSSSIREWDSYVSSLLVAQKNFNTVVTEISLQLREMGRNKFSVAKFSYKKDVEPETKMDLMKQIVTPEGVPMSLGRAMIHQFNHITPELEDMMSGNGEQKGDDF